MPVMYVILFRWGEVQAHATKAGVAWPYNATKRPQFDGFKRRYTALGMTRLDEPGHDIAWMEAQLGDGGRGKHVAPIFARGRRSVS